MRGVLHLEVEILDIGVFIFLPDTEQWMPDANGIMQVKLNEAIPYSVRRLRSSTSLLSPDNNFRITSSIKKPHTMARIFYGKYFRLLRQRYPYLHARPGIGSRRTGRNIGVYPALVKEQFQVYPVV